MHLPTLPLALLLLILPYTLALLSLNAREDETAGGDGSSGGGGTGGTGEGGFVAAVGGAIAGAAGGVASTIQAAGGEQPQPNVGNGRNPVIVPNIAGGEAHIAT